MSKSKLEQSFERFEAVFGENSPQRKDIPGYLKAEVYGRMKHAFKERDGRKFKRVKLYFLKSFHPDLPASVFTRRERQAVFVTLPHIFEGEKLS